MKRYYLTATAVSAALGLSGPTLAGDASAGVRAFKTSCSACHGVTASAVGVGPTLFGVVGRKSGTQAAYAARFSPVMKKAARTWTADAIKAYIANPAGSLPGNRMAFAGVKNPVQVDNIVAYLVTLR